MKLSMYSRVPFRSISKVIGTVSQLVPPAIFHATSTNHTEILARNQCKHVQLLFSPSGVENYLDRIGPVFAQQPVNTTRATELAQIYGVIHLPDVKWRDLGCAFNGSALLTQSFCFKMLTVLVFSSKFLFQKLTSLTVSDKTSNGNFLLREESLYFFIVKAE